MPSFEREKGRESTQADLRSNQVKNLITATLCQRVIMSFLSRKVGF